MCQARAMHLHTSRCRAPIPTPPQRLFAQAPAACRATAPAAACPPGGCAQQTRLQSTCNGTQRRRRSGLTETPKRRGHAVTLGLERPSTPDAHVRCLLACVVCPAPHVARYVPTTRLVVLRLPGQLDLQAAAVEATHAGGQEMCLGMLIPKSWLHPGQPQSVKRTRQGTRRCTTQTFGAGAGWRCLL